LRQGFLPSILPLQHGHDKDSSNDFFKHVWQNNAAQTLPHPQGLLGVLKQMAHSGKLPLTKRGCNIIF
jgi:hypothetical protein